ncbi:hypothetical protein GHT09_005237 [Marmota monax]|uniref:EGF-like domain-containing protein n=1 Tax=Marmota monax TaxID=9995 RepID=A0A834UNV1_MARMO|nr:hypothetical protein GHT09_005237 [Marmota monax]
MALPREPAGSWPAPALTWTLTLALALSPGAAAPWPDCTGAQCPPLEHCIEEALAPGECCATCVQRGCPCEGYQYYDCVRGGFPDGRVPAGRSYLVDFGSTECSCPPGGGKISCRFMLCPELPPNCIEAVVAADSCPQCGRLGCVHRGLKHPAGHTVHLAPCRACHCPDAGGALICYRLPGCEGNASEAEDGDTERHYDDPYSYDQEVAEAEAGEAEAGAGGPPAALGGGNQAPATLQATPWPAALPRPTAAAALGPPAPAQAKSRRVTDDTDDRGQEAQEAIGELEALPTAALAGPGLRAPEAAAPAQSGMEENLIPEAQATPRGSAPKTSASPGSDTEGHSPEPTPPRAPGDPAEPSAPPLPATEAPEQPQAPPTQAGPQFLPQPPRVQEEEDVDPNSVHSVPRGIPEDNGPCRQVCRVVGGMAMCSCFPGYAIMADGVSCEDQDECLAGTHDCGRRQFCVNTLGSFSCVNHTLLCAQGFILNAHRKCVDINECVTDLHTCSRGEHCVNTLGSFRCYKALTCEPGFALKDGECTDVDECATGTHNCQAGFSCQNTRGSFYCQVRQRCMEGFLQDPEGNCVDINECTSLPEPCRSGFSCVNTVGSYTCQRHPLVCRRGYHANQDGSACVDVDECETGLHHCGDTQVCHNLPGSHRCDCKPGFQRDAFSRSCIDVNECWASPGRLCQHTCENTLGSYRCACASGFLLAADGRHCEGTHPPGPWPPGDAHRAGRGPQNPPPRAPKPLGPWWPISLALQKPQVPVFMESV